MKSEQEQNGNQESADNQQFDPNDYSCPDCGWTPKATSKDPEKSLKAHRLRAHKVAWSKAEGSTPRGETIEPTIERLPYEDEALKDILRRYGVRMVDGIVDLVQDYDDFEKLYDLLKRAGVRRDRISMALEAWSQHRGTAIPVTVEEALGMEGRSSIERRYATRPQHRGWDDEYEDYGEDRHKFGPMSDVAMSDLLEAKAEERRARARYYEQGGGKSPDLQRALDKIESLEKQLNDQRYDTLKDEIQKLREERKGDVQTVVDGVKDTVKSIFAYLTGATEDKPPRREKSEPLKREGPLIHTFMPEEMIER